MWEKLSPRHSGVSHYNRDLETHPSRSSALCFDCPVKGSNALFSSLGRLKSDASVRPFTLNAAVPVGAATHTDPLEEMPSEAASVHPRWQASQALSIALMTWDFPEPALPLMTASSCAVPKPTAARAHRRQRRRTGNREREEERTPSHTLSVWSGWSVTHSERLKRLERHTL